MIAIVFDTPPGPESQFVEVERDGKSIEFGDWKEKADGYWHLELVEVERLEKQLAEAQAEVERLQKRVEELGDSLYNKDPDLASRIYDVTPSWAKDEE